MSEKNMTATEVLNIWEKLRNPIATRCHYDLVAVDFYKCSLCEMDTVTLDGEKPIHCTNCGVKFSHWKAEGE